MNKLQITFLTAGLCLLGTVLHAQTNKAAATSTLTPENAPPGSVVNGDVVRAHETPEQHDARMKWWREAKFGMFIHWGLYAIPADGEWHMRQHQEPFAEYSKLAQQFNPTKFNADTWAQVAEDAGMKYMVLTTKHHDGFAMFHSKASSYNIYDATPFKRDPLKELSVACPKHGIKLGTYYSVIADWGHPGGGAGCPKWDHAAQDGDLDHYVNTVSIPQVKELMTNYGPIAVLWFDSDGAQVGTAERAARYEPVVALQPNIIVDPRLTHFPGDFQTAEGHIPMIAPTGDWELCDRTNGSWGFTHAPARPLEMLLHMLVEAWAKGGNVLLNVGPDATGVIPADSVAVLEKIGAWMKVNGEAVYGSTRGPFDYLPWGWTTRKGDALYLFVFNWPADGVLKVPTTTPFSSAHVVAAPGQELTSEIKDGFTLLHLPKTAPDPVVSVIKVVPSGAVAEEKSVLIGKHVTASENEADAQGLTRATDGNWRVKSDHATLQVDLGAPTALGYFRFNTPYVDVAKLTIEAQTAKGWETVFTVDTPKKMQFEGAFPAVTATAVRVTIQANKPEIRSTVWQMYGPF
jgi:alpha-L-fucosidase